MINNHRVQEWTETTVFVPKNARFSDFLPKIIVFALEKRLKCPISATLF